MLAAPIAAGFRVTRANAATSAVYIEDGVAWDGHDPVAYFTTDGPLAGSQDFAYDHNGVTVLFANEEHRAMFADDPMRYSPQYGGYCAYAMSKGQIAPTIPEAWTVYDGKLYLNFSLQARELWLADIPGHIEKADAFWPDVLSG
nr:YHS domain-containing (seleno)protein [Aliiroseovarius sp. S1339]